MNSRIFLLIIYMLSACHLSAQVTTLPLEGERGGGLSLSSALARINERQQEWTITFVADELAGLEVQTSPQEPTAYDLPDDVERLTKGLPVRVKVKKAMRQIYVQRRHDSGTMSLRGKVVDNMTRNDLPGAVVTLMRRDSTVLATTTAKSFWMNRGESCYTADFHFEVPHRPESYILRAIFEGHDTTFVDYTLSDIGRREFIRQLPPILMHKTVRHAMREVTVTASKVVFYHRGDTVVYNADAFQLAEGSMLDALVRQLPGVELKAGGVITVGGKQVDALLLNGKDFFSGDNRVMLENLPAYTVRQLEVYDKYGDKSDFLGQKMESDKRFVMDVRLKREYSIGYLANVEAGVSPLPTSPKGEGTQSNSEQAETSASPLGEDRRGLLRLFAMRFTDHSRLAAYFNANNLNDGERPGEEGGYSMGASTGQQTRQSGGVDYFTEDRDKKWKVEGNVRAERETNDLIRETSRVNFLSTGDTREHSRSVAEDKSVGVSTWNQLQRNFEKLQLSIRPSLNYQHWNNHSAFTSQAFDARDSLINRNLQQGSRRGYSLRPNLSTLWTVKLSGTDDYLEFETDACYDVKSDDRFNRQQVFSLSPFYGDQYYKNRPDRHGKLWAQAMYHWAIRRGLSLETNLSYEYRNTRRESSLFLLDQDPPLTLPVREGVDTTGYLPSYYTKVYTPLPHREGQGGGSAILDPSNSYTSHLTEHYYTLTPVLWWFPKMGGGRWSIGQWLPLRLLDRTLRYQRGQLDTLITHRSFLIGTGNSYAQWIGPGENPHALFIAYRLKAEAPSMTNYVNIRDATDPLNITEGNADLRDTYRHSLQIHHRKNYRKSQVQIRGGVDFVLTQNALAMSYLYDPATGVRTYKPYSVNGNWETSLGYGVGNVPLDKQGRLRFYLAPQFSYRHSVDLTGTTQLERSTVGTSTLSPIMVLKYNFGDLGNVKLDCSPQWRWLHSARPDFEDFHVADYQTTLSTLLNLPWHLQLSTDLTLTARRGYADATMNTTDWMWKARLARSFLKGNLVLMLDGFDLLGQQRSTTSILNAQGRVETWTNAPPRYVLLHAVYRFNRQPLQPAEKRERRAARKARKQKQALDFK